MIELCSIRLKSLLGLQRKKTEDWPGQSHALASATHGHLRVEIYTYEPHSRAISSLMETLFLSLAGYNDVVSTDRDLHLNKNKSTCGEILLKKWTQNFKNEYISLASFIFDKRVIQIWHNENIYDAGTFQNKCVLFIFFSNGRKSRKRWLVAESHKWRENRDFLLETEEEKWFFY